MEMMQEEALIFSFFIIFLEIFKRGARKLISRSKSFRRGKWWMCDGRRRSDRGIGCRVL